MYIFTLLGIILDAIKNGNIGCGNSVGFTDVDIIDKYILPLCDEVSDAHYEVVETGAWYEAIINFGRNPYCDRGEIQSITIQNSDGKSATIEVGRSILEEVSAAILDEAYFEMCDALLT